MFRLLVRISRKKFWSFLISSNISYHTNTAPLLLLVGEQPRHKTWRIATAHSSLPLKFAAMLHTRCLTCQRSRMVLRRSSLRIFPTFSTFASVRPVEGRPECSQPPTEVPHGTIRKAVLNIYAFPMQFFRSEAKFNSTALFLQTSHYKIADRSENVQQWTSVKQQRRELRLQNSINWLENSTATVSRGTTSRTWSQRYVRELSDTPSYGLLNHYVTIITICERAVKSPFSSFTKCIETWDPFSNESLHKFLIFDAVSIVYTGCKLYDRAIVVRFPTEVTDFPLQQSVQTGSGPNPAS
jgi:hypothetical protein